MRKEVSGDENGKVEMANRGLVCTQGCWLCYVGNVK